MLLVPVKGASLDDKGETISKYEGCNWLLLSCNEVARGRSKEVVEEKIIPGVIYRTAQKA